MINKSVSKTGTEQPQSLSPARLRQEFETSLKEIGHAKRASRPRYGVPIFDRLRLKSGGSEERAVADAARALAMLWKLPARAR